MNLIIIIAVIGILGFLISAYNKGITLQNYTKEAFSVMDVYLKKRFDLVPNLVEIVKQYAQHEKNVFTEITNLRAKSYSNLSIEEKMDLNAEIKGAISKIVAVAENYPEVKANENFKTLMTQLDDVENDIAKSRKYYNGTVRELNNYTQMFPTNLICMLFNIKEQKFFEITEDERKNVEVKF